MADLSDFYNLFGYFADQDLSPLRDMHLLGATFSRLSPGQLASPNRLPASIDFGWVPETVVHQNSVHWLNSQLQQQQDPSMVVEFPGAFATLPVGDGVYNLVFARLDLSQSRQTIVQQPATVQAQASAGNSWENIAGTSAWTSSSSQVKTEVKAEVKAEVKTEFKAQVIAEFKTEVKTEPKAEISSGIRSVASGGFVSGSNVMAIIDLDSPPVVSRFRQAIPQRDFGLVIEQRLQPVPCCGVCCWPVFEGDRCFCPFCFWWFHSNCYFSLTHVHVATRI